MFTITNFVLTRSESDKISLSGAKTLNVALYRYVPKLSQFKDVIGKKWRAIEPDILLNFVDWDCYSNDPCGEIDVFIFDGIYLPYFIKKGYLIPFNPNDINDKEDIFGFILDGCMNDSIIYGIPQLICTKLLFYRQEDTSMQCIKNLKQLYKILGDNKSCQIPPDTNSGLLLNLFDGIIAACVYFETLAAGDKHFDDSNIYPYLNNLNKYALGNLKLLVSMAGKEQAQYVPQPYDPYIRASWFAEGRGRAYIGYSESIINMPDNIDFKLFSWSTCSSPVFYSDIVGISSSITDRGKKALAIKLANIITATDTIEECIRPINEYKYPQYLLPARRSVYLKLKSDFPIYNKFFKLVNKPENSILRMGPEARQWIVSASGIIRKKLGLPDT